MEKYREFYSFRLHEIIETKGIKEAIIERDREKLFNLMDKRWKILQRENKFLQIMHFHLANGESFLRMHKKDKFGDRIALKRDMVAEVHREKRELHNYESGIHYLAYRHFKPIFYNSEYIGALEIGCRPDQILNTMDNLHNIKGTLFIRETSFIGYKRAEDFQIRDFQLQYKTVPNSNILEKLPKDFMLDRDSNSSMETINIDGVNYVIYILSLNRDAKFLFIKNISTEEGHFKNNLNFFILLFSIFGTVLGSVFYYGFNSIVREIDREKLFNKSILDNSEHLIIATDKKGVITLFNKSAEERLGYSADEVIGKETLLLFHKKSELLKKSEKLSRLFNTNIEPNATIFFQKTIRGLTNISEWNYLPKDGKEFFVSLSITTIIDNGEISGFLAVAQDITDRKKLENELDVQREELKTIVETSRDGIAVLDKETNFLFSNESYMKMTGFTESELLSKTCKELSVSTDKERVQKALKEVKKIGFIDNFERTCIVKSGELRKVNMSIAMMPDRERFLISTKDVTKLKENERVISEYLNMINENIITSTTDLNGVITYVSKAFLDVSGYKWDDLVGQSHRVIKHPDESEDVYKDMWNSLTNNKTWRGEIKNRKRDGSLYWVKATISPIFDEKGEKVGYTAIRQDITDKKVIEQLSITDGLTGIYNRRYFNKIFPKVINSSKRNGDMLSFLIMDIDHFKQYNDTYGHQAGDRVLIEVAKSIQENLKRADDYCFRLGGEEFGVLYKSKDSDKAFKFAEKIRKDIEDLKIEHKENSASKYVTASMGLFCKDSEFIIDKDFVYRESDILLYKAKESGRNRVCV